MEESLCPDCGKQMETYYGVKCFFCKKPEGKTEKVYNLIEVLMYLDKKRPGLKRRIWDELCDYKQFNNDSYGHYMLPKHHGKGYKTRKDLQEDLELIYQEYPDAEEALWEVSW